MVEVIKAISLPDLASAERGNTACRAPERFTNQSGLKTWATPIPTKTKSIRTSSGFFISHFL